MTLLVNDLVKIKSLPGDFYVIELHPGTNCVSLMSEDNRCIYVSRTQLEVNNEKEV